MHAFVEIRFCLASVNISSLWCNLKRRRLWLCQIPFKYHLGGQFSIYLKLRVRAVLLSYTGAKKSSIIWVRTRHLQRRTAMPLVHSWALVGSSVGNVGGIWFMWEQVFALLSPERQPNCCLLNSHMAFSVWEAWQHTDYCFQFSPKILVPLSTT